MGHPARNVAASVQAKYKEVQEIIDGGANGPSNALGYQFLEKIVQIPFRLPKASESLLVKLVHGSLKAQLVPDSNRQGAVNHAEELISKAEAAGRSLQDAVTSVQQAPPNPRGSCPGSATEHFC